MREVFDKDLICIGEQVKKLRKRNDYSQEKLAELAGVSVMTISRIETGSTAMNVQMLMKLSEILGVPVTEILCRTKEPA